MTELPLQQEEFEPTQGSTFSRTRGSSPAWNAPTGPSLQLHPLLCQGDSAPALALCLWDSCLPLVPQFCTCKLRITIGLPRGLSEDSMKSRGRAGQGKLVAIIALLAAHSTKPWLLTCQVPQVLQAEDPQWHGETVWVGD